MFGKDEYELIYIIRMLILDFEERCPLPNFWNIDFKTFMVDMLYRAQISVFLKL